ncbi:MAG TPA: hypothetical protein VGE58_03800 [Daejeonella sp.]
MTKLIQPLIRVEYIIAALTALTITLSLFYIDEGKYDFDGIFKPDNLFFLLVYLSAFVGYQLGIHNLLQFIVRNKSQKIISAILAAVSLPLAIVIFLWLVKTV